MRIIACLDPGADSARFVPYAEGIAVELRADLTVVRSDAPPADLGAADMLVALRSRTFALCGHSESLWRRLLRESDRPVCLVHGWSVERGAAFSARRVVCEVDLDGKDGAPIRHAAAIAAAASGELILFSSVPVADERLLVRGVEGPGGPPLSEQEAERRMRSLSETVATAHQTRVVTGNPIHRDALIVTRRSSAVAALHVARGCAVIAVAPSAVGQPGRERPEHAPAVAHAYPRL